jgi:hypothetical protein
MSTRIPYRLHQHGVKLPLRELLRLPRYWLACRHHLIDGAATGRRQHWRSLRHRHDHWLSSWWLVTALQAQPNLLGADRVTAIPEPARDLCGALPCGPEFFEQCYVCRIPAHRRCLYADSEPQASRNAKEPRLNSGKGPFLDGRCDRNFIRFRSLSFYYLVLVRAA